MIAHKYRRPSFEVLFALDHKLDIQDATSNIVETPSDYPVDIVTLSDERQSHGDYDSPYRAQAESGDVEREADIVSRHRVRLR